MKLNLLRILLFAFLISLNSFSQETKKKKTQNGNFIEEYYVLKENKQIKQGQYIKFNRDFLDRKIPIEFGFFEKGKRVGEWYYFYFNGSLKSYGNFVDGSKQGIWKEFYSNISFMDSSITKLFDINNNMQIDKDGHITVQVDKSKISAIGVYDSDIKLGTWNYYDRLGLLIHKYNYYDNKLLLSSVTDSMNYCCPYLGGIDRFYNSFFESNIELGPINSNTDTKATIRLISNDRNLNTEIISSIGDDKFALKFEKVIRNLPNDWIFEYLKKPTIANCEINRERNKALYNIEFRSN